MPATTPTAIKNYDNVIEQYPASNKVPVSRLHKGKALIASKQNAAGVRELRSLIQRFPNSPEAMQARSKLSGMGVTGQSHAAKSLIYEIREPPEQLRRAMPGLLCFVQGGTLA